MKTSNRFILALLAVLLLGGHSTVIKAETFESVKKKVINNTYSVSKNGLLYVDNRFGNITITHWDKAEVSIRVEIESVASKEQRAQQNIERTKIDLKQEGDKVSAVTSYGKTSQQGGNNERLTVDYYISIPSTMNLDLNQKYGNINLPSKNDGVTKVAVKFGNLDAGSFTKTLNLDVKYGNVNVNDVTDASFVFGFCGDVEIGNGKKLTIDSKYSTLNMKNADILKLENKFGNMDIKELKKTNINMKYSDVTIEHLLDELIVGELDFGTLTIENLNANFGRIQAEARYGTLDIQISPKAAFVIDAESVGDNLKLKNLKETKHDVIDKTDHYVEINGGGSRKISFDGNRYSNLKIRSKSN
ncbi:hypothetical protein [Massilibacteroides sp.]|uniref:hypothetical protein n=1 Tax=Massilibacteroides sp. TaxID=2034766 RepID=UPI002634FAC1|nr:hypothetical protein [Massilibacteroides sp.]MDD4514175.1 hypothetical protein [Massilibacteroides sp.]